MLSSRAACYHKLLITLLRMLITIQGNWEFEEGCAQINAPALTLISKGTRLNMVLITRANAERH